MRVFNLLIVALLAVSTFGCSALKGMPEKQPTSEVQSVTVPSVDTDGFVLRYELRIDNPSDRSIPVNDVIFDLMMQGDKVLEDRIELSTNIPPGQSKIETFDVPVTWSNVLEAAENANLGDGKVTYAFDGKMLLPDTAFLDSTPIEFTSEIDLVEQVQEAISDVDLTELPELAELAKQLGIEDMGSGLIPDEVPGF
jgi:LEA14-like dessication related protein